MTFRPLITSWIRLSAFILVIVTLHLPLLADVDPNTSYVEVKKPLIKVYETPTQNGMVAYTTHQGIIFRVINTTDTFYNIELLNGDTAWVNDNDVRPYERPSRPPIFRMGIVNNVVSTKEFIVPVSKNVESVPSESAIPTDDTIVPIPFSRTYQYPELPSNFNLDINGFYEARFSVRDFNPKDVNSDIFETIRRDPIYNKLPRDVLAGDPKLDFRLKLAIDGQLNDDLTVHYNLEQEPDFPGVYDIQVNYRTTELQFYHFDVNFESDTFFKVKKALDGVRGSIKEENWEAQFASGRQRSEPQKQEQFGNGQETIQLRNRSILRGSVTVFINNRSQSEGPDYDVNYFEGKITFKNPPQKNDLIKVIYEFTNPIADFIPILSQKSFLGLQAKWKQKSEDRRIRLKNKKVDILWPKTSTENEQNIEFFLNRTPLVFGSEDIRLNDRKLRRNKDYYIKASNGKITLQNIVLLDNDRLTADYSYFITEKYIEDIIGTGSPGPYQLQHSNIILSSARVEIDGDPVQEGIDYLIDNDRGRIEFSYPILYPKIISVEYTAIKTELEKAEVKESPFSLGVTYLNESTNSDEEELIKNGSDDNVKIGTNNIIILENFPLINTNALSIRLEGSDSPLPTSSYTILNAYTGEIELKGINPNTTRIDTVTYQYQNSFPTQRSFRGQTAKSSSLYTIADIELTDTPVKFNSIDTIRFYGRVGNSNINSGINEFIELQEGTEFVIDYQEDDESPGVDITIQFFTTLDNGASVLDEYPQDHNTLTLFYDYTPETGPDEGRLSQTMVGVEAKTKLNEHWSIEAEIAGTQHNLSQNRVFESTNITGNGQENFTYQIGRSNLVEDSETVTFADTELGITSNILTKDENYFINYRSGTIRFKDLTPEPKHRINITYEYLDPTGLGQEAETQDYAFSTVVGTAYKSDNLNATLSIKNIDKDFLPIAPIEEDNGSTIFEGRADWLIDDDTEVDITYENRRTLRTFSDVDSDIYLNENDILTNAKFTLFDFFSNTTSFRFFDQVQDIKPEEDTHDIDNRTIAFGLGSEFGPDVFSNKINYTFSRKESDYIDKDNKIETNEFNLGWNSRLKFQDLPIAGNVSITPKASFAQSLTERAATSNPDEKSERRTLGSGLTVRPFNELKGVFSYDKTDIENERGNTRNITTITNLLSDIDYDPFSWLKTGFLFRQNQSENPLIGQEGQVSETTVYEIKRFSPAGFLNHHNIGGNAISRSLRKSYLTYRNSKKESRENGQRKRNNTISDVINLRDFQPIKGFKLNSLGYTIEDTDNSNIINSSTTSQNIFTRDFEKLTTDIAIKLDIPFIDIFNYSIKTETRAEEREDILIANSGTSNITQHRNPFASRTQKVVIDTKPTLQAINSFTGLYLGPSTLQFTENFNDRTNETIKIASSNSRRDNPVTTNDDAKTQILTLQGTYSPFNLFDTTGSLSSQDDVFNRNINTSDQGSILKETLSGDITMTFTLLKKVTVKVSYLASRLNQHRGPSTNMTKRDIQGLLGSSGTPDNTELFYSKNQQLKSTITFFPINFFGITTGGEYRQINEQITTQNSTDSEISQFIGIAGIILKPLPKWDINLDGEFKQTSVNGEDQGNGFTATLATKYKLFESQNFTINLDGNIRHRNGIDLNDLDKARNLGGSGRSIQTDVAERDDTTFVGALSMNLVFPMTNSPYIDNITITAEGHMKKIVDNKNESNEYDITGLVVRGTLNF